MNTEEQMGGETTRKRERRGEHGPGTSTGWPLTAHDRRCQTKKGQNFAWKRRIGGGTHAELRAL